MPTTVVLSLFSKVHVNTGGNTQVQYTKGFAFGQLCLGVGV